MRFLRPALPLVLVGLALWSLLGCTGGTNAPDAFGGVVPITVSCDATAASVLVGTTSVQITARARRGAVAAASETVTFTTTRGSISPTTALTDSTGTAVAFFNAPGTAGAVTIQTIVTDHATGDVSTSTCVIDVTLPHDPQLTVNLITPSAAAGFSVQVVYDSSRVDLPAGAITALFPFNSCSQIANDDNVAIARLNVACATLQTSNGPIARFTFNHLSGPDLNASDFAITCTAFDERGAQVSAACSGTVLQL